MEVPVILLCSYRDTYVYFVGLYFHDFRGLRAVHKIKFLRLRPPYRTDSYRQE